MSLIDPHLGTGATNIPISNSEIQTFKMCRRSWMLQYYSGLTPVDRKLTGPLPLGIRVHEAAERHYRDGEDMLEAYLDLFRKDEILFKESGQDFFDDLEKTFYSEGELGRIMVEGYQEWMRDESGLAEFEITDIENALQYQVLDGRVNLIGKVDLELTDKNDGSVYIGDLKTTAQLTTYHNVSHMSEQLMLYTMLRRLTSERRTDGGVYILLKKVKRSARATPPFYEKMVVRFNETTIENFWTRIIGTLGDMLAVRDALDGGADHHLVAYPSVSESCKWRCPFYSMCSMMDDGSDWERWLETYTEKYNPYERYGNQLDNLE